MFEANNMTTNAIRIQPPAPPADAHLTGDNRPPSATTSRVSLTGNRDYGMKFMGGVDDMGASATLSHDHSNSDSNRLIATPTESEASFAYESQPQPQVLSNPQPPTYRESQSRNRLRRPIDPRGDEVDEGDEGCHPFFIGWWDMLKGLLYIIGGAFKIPFTILNGIAGVLWYIPKLYGDKTVRPWPKIAGFTSGVTTGCEALALGLWDGLTDWIILPIKLAKQEGFLGFVKGFCQGWPNMALKPAYGGLAFIGNPIYGIYKECSNIKIIIKRETKPREKVDKSPV